MRFSQKGWQKKDAFVLEIISNGKKLINIVRHRCRNTYGYRGRLILSLGWRREVIDITKAVKSIPISAESFALWVPFSKYHSQIQFRKKGRFVAWGWRNFHFVWPNLWGDIRFRTHTSNLTEKSEIFRSFGRLDVPNRFLCYTDDCKEIILVEEPHEPFDRSFILFCLPTSPLPSLAQILELGVLCKTSFTARSPREEPERKYRAE